MSKLVLVSHIGFGKRRIAMRKEVLFAVIGGVVGAVLACWRVGSRH